MYRSLFFNKVTGLHPTSLFKNELRRKFFSVDFAKFLGPFSFAGHLQAAASVSKHVGKIIKCSFIKGWVRVTHINFCTQYVIMTLAGRGWEEGGRGGRGVIANDVLKKRKVMEFRSLCPATAHLSRCSISRNSNRQVIRSSL